MITRFCSWVAFAVLAGTLPALADEPRHNIILFVPDGLRAGIVTTDTAPAIAEIRDKGVNFANSHSLFPTFTMPNSSGMATGHHLGDAGVFGNVLYAGFPIKSAKSARIAFIENDGVLGDIDEHFSGNFIDEETILHVAHRVASTQRRSESLDQPSSSIIRRAVAAKASSSMMPQDRKLGYRSRRGSAML